MQMAGRIRRFLFRDLSASPNPAHASSGVRTFQAPRYWKSNVCGGAVAGIGAAGLFTVVGGILLWQSHPWEGRLWGAGLILFGILTVWALLAGNLVGVSPYAAEIDDGKGVLFYAPFKRIYLPIQEVKRVTWSWLWLGWFVSFKHRRGLLLGFVIHRAWGQQGRDLAQAIREELARSA